MSAPSEVDRPSARGDETPKRTDRWWQRIRPDRVWTAAWLRYDEESRTRIRSMLWSDGGGYIWRFSVMMAASAVIAAVGLNLSSAAVVIGAMLVAPLMTPVMGLAAAAAGGNGAPAARSAAIVVGATAGVIGVAYIVSALLPQVNNPVTTELLARTAPDVRDLVVAIAAGTAGAYATAREDISTSLPGAAVAVALVPPLAAVGICLQIGRSELAFGAFLLYAANFIGILVAAVIVLALTGFAEPPFIRGGGRVAAFTVTVSVIALIAVTLPLLTAVDAAASGARRDAAVEAAVAGWASGNSAPVLIRGVRVVDGAPPRVEIDLSGSGTLERPDALVTALEAELGADVEVDLRWASSVIRPDGVPITVDDPARSDPRSTVRAVLRTEGVGGVDVEEVTVEGTRATVDLVGADITAVDDALRDALVNALGVDELEIRWTNRYGVESDQLALTRRVDEWARRAGVQVLAITATDDGVVVDVAATEAPAASQVAELEDRLDQPATVRWAPLLPVG